jgi:hypothetical protein
VRFRADSVRSICECQTVAVGVRTDSVDGASDALRTLLPLQFK